MSRFNFIDHTGDIFHRLTVTNRAPDRRKVTYWNCICDCGNKVIVRGTSLRGGITGSCGCYRKTRGETHGLSESRVYNIYHGMIQRCYNPKSHMFKNYGDRGISICDRWRNSFPDFVSDMGEPPKNMSIERVNNNGNYNPDNCKWADVAEQGNNRRTNKFITFNGETLTHVQWSRKLGGCDGLIKARIRVGWSEHRAVSTPKH